MPDTLSLLFLALQHISAVAKFAIAGKLARERLVERYPFFTAAMIVSAVSQAWLLSTLWLHPDIPSRQHAYQQAWRIATPFQVSASFAVAVEALWVMARHYPGARNLMIWTVGICSAASAAVVLPYAFGVPTFLVKARAGWKLALLVGVLVARGLLGKQEPGMSRNVRLYSFAVLLAMSGSVGGDLAGAASRAYWVQAVSKAVLIGAPLAACAWWMRMRASGETFTPTFGPSPADLEEEARRVEKAIAKAAGQQ